MALANMKMSEAENARMSELSEKQCEDVISPLEKTNSMLYFGFIKSEFAKIPSIYEAVRRGLIETPDDLQ